MLRTRRRPIEFHPAVTAGGLVDVHPEENIKMAGADQSEYKEGTRIKLGMIFCLANCALIARGQKTILILYYESCS